MANGNNFLRGFLETPNIQRGLFSNALATQPKRVRDFFAPRFNELFNEFQGGLARQAQAGQLPTGTFGGFLKGINLGTRFGQFSPQQRRDFSAQTLTPRTKFLNF